VAPQMIERGSGKIVNTCSVTSEVGRETIGPYTASKGGLRQLTRAMCADWGRHGIQANGIGPGYFRTEMNRDLQESPAFVEWLEQRVPAGRWGRVEELGGAVVFLASAASDYVNGQILYVDGGMLAVL
jgi:gluconate 5-dehydrogenase